MVRVNDTDIFLLVAIPVVSTVVINCITFAALFLFYKYFYVQLYNLIIQSVITMF